MNSKRAVPRYSTGEEIANSVTHGIGVLFSITALCIMTAFASLAGDVWHIVGCSIFGATLILLYTFSTLYHSIPIPRAKAVLRIMDHSAIFLLIAGSYTPFTLVNLRGPWGWWLFGIVWGIALLGILFQIVLIRWTFLSLALYVFMGWVVVAAVKPLLATVETGGLLLLLSGGISYTAGIVFYVRKEMKYHHAIWHLFVLAGSVFHFLSVLFYVIPSLN